MSRTRSFVLVPSAARPKLAVPARPFPAAAAIARSHSAPGSFAAAVRTQLMSAAFATGLGGLLLRDRINVDSPENAVGIDDFLSDILGEPVVVGLRVGPPRANRKPVLPVVTRSGRLIAYAKLGVNELTDRLVSAEGAALAALGRLDLGEVVVPAALFSGEWQHHQLLVQSPLPVRRSVGPDLAARTIAAMVAVARADNPRRVPLAQVPWWARTRALAAALPPSQNRGPLQDIGETLAGQTGRHLLAGGWHGDWNPGNCAVVPGSVLVWDWERYETGVPLGFDALHLRLQSAITSGVPLAVAASALLAEAAVLLSPFGVPRTDAELVARLYLWGLGVRYATDDQLQAGAAVGRLGDWLIPVLAQSTMKAS